MQRVSKSNYVAGSGGGIPPAANNNKGRMQAESAATSAEELILMFKDRPVANRKDSKAGPIVKITGKHDVQAGTFTGTVDLKEIKFRDMRELQQNSHYTIEGNKITVPNTLVCSERSLVRRNNDRFLVERTIQKPHTAGSNDSPVNYSALSKRGSKWEALDLALPRKLELEKIENRNVRPSAMQATNDEPSNANRPAIHELLSKEEIDAINAYAMTEGYGYNDFLRKGCPEDHPDYDKYQTAIAHFTNAIKKLAAAGYTCDRTLFRGISGDSMSDTWYIDQPFVEGRKYRDLAIMSTSSDKSAAAGFLEGESYLDKAPVFPAVVAHVFAAKNTLNHASIVEAVQHTKKQSEHPFIPGVEFRTLLKARDKKDNDVIFIEKLYQKNIHFHKTVMEEISDDPSQTRGTTNTEMGLMLPQSASYFGQLAHAAKILMTYLDMPDALEKTHRMLQHHATRAGKESRGLDARDLPPSTRSSLSEPISSEEKSELSPLMHMQPVDAFHLLKRHATAIAASLSPELQEEIGSELEWTESFVHALHDERMEKEKSESQFEKLISRFEKNALARWTELDSIFNASVAPEKIAAGCRRILATLTGPQDLDVMAGMLSCLKNRNADMLVPELLKDICDTGKRLELTNHSIGLACRSVASRLADGDATYREGSIWAHVTRQPLSSRHAIEIIEQIKMDALNQSNNQHPGLEQATYAEAPSSEDPDKWNDPREYDFDINL